MGGVPRGRPKSSLLKKTRGEGVRSAPFRAKSVVFLKGQPVARAEGGPGRRANLKINHLVCGSGPNRPYMLAITTTSERIGHWIRMRRSLAPFSGLES